MTHPSRAGALRLTVGALGLVVFLALVAGLLLFNYTSGLALIAGALVALALIGLVRFLARRGWKAWLLAGLATGFGLAVFLVLLLFTRDRYYSGYPNLICPIASYHAVVAPDSTRLNGFQIQETVTLVEGGEFTPPDTWSAEMVDNQPGYRLPAGQAAIDSRGFLLKEARVDPSVTCNESALVELRDVPRNAFYAAAYARDLQQYPYVDTETVTWDPGSGEIRFSYIVPPFQILRPVLSPLIGASSISQWLLGLLALLGTFVFTPIVRPVLEEFAQNWLKKKLHVGDHPAGV